MKTLIEIVFGLMFLFVSVAQAAGDEPNGLNNTYCACSLTKEGYEKGVTMAKQMIAQPRPYLHREEIAYAKKRLPQLEDNLAAIGDYMKTLKKVDCKPTAYTTDIHNYCSEHAHDWVVEEKRKTPEVAEYRKAVKAEADRLIQEGNEDEEKRIKNDVWLK